jgi:hypothetical protein
MKKMVVRSPGSRPLGHGLQGAAQQLAAAGLGQHTVTNARAPGAPRRPAGVHLLHDLAFELEAGAASSGQPRGILGHGKGHGHLALELSATPTTATSAMLGWR